MSRKGPSDQLPAESISLRLEPNQSFCEDMIQGWFVTTELPAPFPSELPVYEGLIDVRVFAEAFERANEYSSNLPTTLLSGRVLP